MKRSDPIPNLHSKPLLPQVEQVQDAAKEDPDQDARQEAKDEVVPVLSGRTIKGVALEDR